MDVVIREAPNRPIFVGGTGRSGTTIAGRLLGHHPDLRCTNPRELRFISSQGGLADAVAGRVAPEVVVTNIWNHWFERTKPSGATSGLYRRVTREEMTDLASRFVSEFAADPVAAARRFAATIVASRAKGDPDGRWVDTTPANARAADRVLALFPEGVVVHMMRDGRDVAASFVSKPFGPTEVLAGLEAWRERMIDAWRAEQASPPGSVVRIDLEQLAVTDRTATLSRLLEGIGVSDHRAVHDWLDRRVSAEQAHVGRWRKDYDAATAAKIDERYAQIIGELDSLGVPHP